MDLRPFVFVFTLTCYGAWGDVYIHKKYNNSTDVIIKRYNDIPALGWGGSLRYGLTGKIVYADPPDGCGRISGPPPQLEVPVVLVRRGNCNFDIKASNAQNAGYKAVIVHNEDSDDLIAMSGGSHASSVKIPAVFIGLSDAIAINSSYLYNEDTDITVQLDASYSPNTFLDRYVWPFLGSVVLIFFVLLIYSLYKWVGDRRRRRRNRLSVKKLQKIPVKKFVKGDPYDICAICLDEYEEDDQLRLLPCNHAYHAKCIDPWLTKTKRQCPVCKRKVSPGSGNSNPAPPAPIVAPSDELPSPTAEGELPRDPDEDDDDGEREEEQNESTPLVSVEGADEIAVRRPPNLYHRLRIAVTSWRRRHEDDDDDDEDRNDNHHNRFDRTRSFGYGSLGEVPTEFNPTLPPPPARSLQSHSLNESPTSSTESSVTQNKRFVHNGEQPSQLTECEDSNLATFVSQGRTV